MHEHPTVGTALQVPETHNYSIMGPITYRHIKKKVNIWFPYYVFVLYIKLLVPNTADSSLSIIEEHVVSSTILLLLQAFLLHCLIV